MRRERGELREALGAFRSVFWAVGGFSLVVNVLLLAPALYMLQVYDRVLASRNEVTLIMLTMILVGLLLLEALIELVRSKVLVKASAALDVRLSPRVFDASFERSLRQGRGSAAQALADLGQVRQFLTGKGLFAFFDAPWTPIYIAVIYLLDPWLGYFAAGAALVLFALAWVNERATGRALEQAGDISHSASHEAATQLRNAEVIEALGMLPALRNRWFERQRRFLATQSVASERAATLGAATKFLRAAFQSGVLGLGAYLVIQNQLTPGAMIAASILLGRALAPVDLAIATWRSLVGARAAYRRLAELLQGYPARGETTRLPRPQGAVAVESLVLGAPGREQPILRGVNLRVPAGTCVAIVGPSAAGKSTLARALVGVWAPMSGSVRLDGADVARWNKAELGPSIGYLPQDVELFDGTIAENIARFGERDDDRIVQAARKAGVHEMVLRLPEGYDTRIGEGGVALSGGQRQRVALARALYGDPALVVLDEPNANLDDAGDAALAAALRQLKEEGRTVFVVTHRVNLLAAVDTVALLSEGRLRAYGPRDTVLKGATKPQQQLSEAA
jgi:ATP-binding cassette subfamily C exporter for protease/lipase